MPPTPSHNEMTDTVVVVTGAAPLTHQAVASVPDDAIVIAADGALDHALAAGLVPSKLIGDLDSISASGRSWAEQHAAIEQHDTDKDHTDTELALAAAADLNPRRLVMLAGDGDRLDHTLAAIAALGHPSLTSIQTIEGWWADQALTIVHGPGRVHIPSVIGATVSLLALHGRCTGVSIDGVQWPLTDADLEPGIGLGVSNTATTETILVAVSSGVLTIVRPHDASSPTPTETS